ncbi:GerMN domain-containing protein [Bacillus rubiinfantis]|uniref:GerMN domain-containing protein n=1 Tax=Bacillus rubiinfantis TaxID=1499680 RepID=UPI0005AA294E|nr:GerMN domain-containing protein [Bacillus rubiinfantis]
MAKKKAKIIGYTVLTSTFLLSGCGLLGGETKQKIDPPKTVSVSKEQDKKQAAEENTKSIKTELYLIDKNGYVVPQTLNLQPTKSVAKQALEHLVVNGPVSELLPNDFRAVIPEETDISVDIQDGVATVDFSKEFKNYQPEDEMKILQSVTWTLTQFDNVGSVKLSMNGHPLTKMPVKGTPIGDNLTRASGINIDTTDVVDITNTKPVTVYFIGGEEGSYYYVPVTRRVSNNDQEMITAAVNELVKGPSEKSNLVSDFAPDVKLLDSPKYENGKVTLNFNENLYNSFKEKEVSQHLLDSLVLTLTEQKGVEKVAVQVKGNAELKNDQGKKLTEPVTRPEKVNTGSF